MVTKQFEQADETAKQGREAKEEPKAIELYQSVLKLRPDWSVGFLGAVIV